MNYIRDDVDGAEVSPGHIKAVYVGDAALPTHIQLQRSCNISKRYKLYAL